MRVGIIGGGQLARMLALAGYPLGLRFRVYDPSPDACAGQLAPLTVGAFDDLDALRAFAAGVDVVTFDFENVPAASLRALAARVRVAPGPALLEVAQDRVSEKRAAEALGVPCGPWWAVDDGAALASLLEGRPGEYVLKTRRFGYDGKGQVRIGAGRDREVAIRLADTQPCILEAVVPFDRELSVIATRAADGELRCYPLTENRHVEGILRSSLAPAPDAQRFQSLAEDFIRAIADRHDYVGTLALELFQVGEHLLFNEMAPRVHNSGHWTIDGAVCSQFENHLRAICGWPLGEAAAIGLAHMENFIGAVPPAASLLGEPYCYLHDYGKAPRAGRKVGHLTRLLLGLIDSSH
ncbi:MAG: 5-(carboxyamino)imidazole ribonucleotide synthase [Xanthomonadales bacterium]|jgi:5-(carboxyamino)imidazole ribonucleotide synthase|nr:5-(carboxyamino)imidazole ribonucleotide synthase [Xanthomonadales bacterium]